MNDERAEREQQANLDKAKKAMVEVSAEVMQSKDFAGFTVYVDDNFHYMDESKRIELGMFPTYAGALSACKEIVDDFLRSNYKPEMTAVELISIYKNFGDDPWISPDPEGFSAWKYAEERAREIAGNPPPSSISGANYYHTVTEGIGYYEMGLLDEAEATLGSVPADAGADYFAAQRQLILVYLARGANQTAAEIGLHVIEQGSLTYSSIVNTMLALDLLARVREARDLLRRLEEIGYNLNDEAYQMAAFSAQLGEFDEALRWLEVEYRRSEDYWMRSLLDVELTPFWRFLAAGELSVEQAHRLLLPCFERVAAKATSFSDEIGVDARDMEAMPAKFRAFLKHRPEAGYKFFDFHSGGSELATEYLKWQRQAMNASLKALAAGLSKAKEMVIGKQLEYATAQARVGNHLAARWHILWALSQRPEMMPDFRGHPDLSPLRSLLDEIKAAQEAVPDFVARVERAHRLSSQGDGDAAWEVLSEIPSALHSNSLYLLRLAGCYDADQDFARSLPIWKELQTRWPQDAVGFGNGVTALMKLGRWEEAERLLNDAPRCYQKFRLYRSQLAALKPRNANGLCAKGSVTFRGHPGLNGIVFSKD